VLKEVFGEEAERLRRLLEGLQVWGMAPATSTTSLLRH
jgi:hypothetical protein